MVLRRRDPSKKEDLPVDVDTSQGHGGSDDLVITEFFEFVRGNAEPRCRPREAALPVAVGLAATVSSDENRVVDMKDFAV